MAMETNEAKKSAQPAPGEADRAMRDFETHFKKFEMEIEARLANLSKELRQAQPAPEKPAGSSRDPSRTVFIAGNSGSSPSLDRVIDDSLRSLLGVVPKAGDPNALVELLNRVFIAQETDGKRTWKLRPVSYSPRLESSEALTGVQASIYARAKERLDSSKDALASLRGIRPDRDDEAIDAARALLQAKWEQFVQEMGNPGGVNLPRADQLKKEIGRNHRGLAHPNDSVFSYIAILGAELGIFKAIGRYPDLDSNSQPIPTRRYAITTPDDSALTAFLLVRGDIEATLNEYDEYKKLLADDLGARVAGIKQLLEAVDETLQAMLEELETIRFTAVERRTFIIGGAPPADVINFEDLLSWTGNFVRFEANQLMDSAGRWGIVSLARTAETLSSLLGKAAGAGNVPVEVQSSNVLSYVLEIKQYLDQVVIKAKLEDTQLRNA